MLRRYMATYDAEKAAQAHALFSPAGRRMSKTVDANTTDYLWSNVGRLPVVLYDGNYYVYGRGLISKTDSQSDQLYYLADGLGSTTGLTDDQGDVVGTYTYDAFGAIRSETGGQANDFKFTRQQLDNETDFYYLRARYYDPATGRLLTPDPFAGYMPLPKSLSRYPYALNNPATFADPNGLWPGEDAWNATTDAVGGVVDTGADIAGDVIGGVTEPFEGLSEGIGVSAHVIAGLVLIEAVHLPEEIAIAALLLSGQPELIVPLAVAYEKFVWPADLLAACLITGIGPCGEDSADARTSVEPQQRTPQGGSTDAKE